MEDGLNLSIADSLWRLRSCLAWPLLTLSLLALLLPSPAHAHPHAFIDIRIVVLFDEDGRAVGLRQHWLFDPFYTAFAVEGLPQNDSGGPRADVLAELMEVNMGNLKPYDYFTRVEANGSAMPFAGVSELSTGMRDGRLEMSFLLSFAAPTAAPSLRYAVFDPTYYIEVLHAEADDAIRLVDAPAGCSSRLQPPAPNPEMVALAYSLDRTESAGDTLGRHFAEWVTVACD